MTQIQRQTFQIINNIHTYFLAFYLFISFFLHNFKKNYISIPSSNQGQLQFVVSIGCHTLKWFHSRM